MPAAIATYKSEAKNVDFDALGGAILNWIAGSSPTPTNIRKSGGMVLMSFASQLSDVGFLQISAYEWNISAFGATYASNVMGSGWRIIPYGHPMEMTFGDGASSILQWGMSVTQALSSENSVVVLVGMRASQTDGSGIVPTSASDVSVHIVIPGIIVSSPFKFH